jgi:hypothetical protein
MHDSLLSRFRGAFLGALLGEALGVHVLPYQQPQSGWQQLTRGRFDKELGQPTCVNRGVKLMLTQTLMLIGDQAHVTRSAEQSDLNELSSAKYSENRTSAVVDAVGESLLARLPLALFYHDQPLRYRAALQAISPLAGDGATRQATGSLAIPDSTLAAEVVGQVVSLILRERFTRLELIPQVLKDLDLQDSSPELAHDLMQMQSWLERPCTLADVARYAKQMATRSGTPAQASLTVVLVLYSFLATPDDFRLSVLRSVQLHSSVLLPTLTGVISGLYNGLSGLPIAWRQQVESSRVADLYERWGITSKAEVEHIADRLLACWSGASEPAVWLQQPGFNRITAAPRTIRPD